MSTKKEIRKAIKIRYKLLRDDSRESLKDSYDGWEQGYLAAMNQALYILEDEFKRGEKS